MAEILHTSSRYSPKEEVCKISAKSDHYWSLQAAPKFSDRQTYIHTLSDSSSTEVENIFEGKSEGKWLFVILEENDPVFLKENDFMYFSMKVASSFQRKIFYFWRKMATYFWRKMATYFWRKMNFCIFRGKCCIF